MFFCSCVILKLLFCKNVLSNVCKHNTILHSVKHTYSLHQSLISHFLGLWRRPRFLPQFFREIKSRFRNPKFPLYLLVPHHALHIQNICQRIYLQQCCVFFSVQSISCLSEHQLTRRWGTRARTRTRIWGAARSRLGNETQRSFTDQQVGGDEDEDLNRRGNFVKLFQKYYLRSRFCKNFKKNHLTSCPDYACKIGDCTAAENATRHRDHSQIGRSAAAEDETKQMLIVEANF